MRRQYRLVRWGVPAGVEGVMGDLRFFSGDLLNNPSVDHANIRVIEEEVRETRQWSLEDFYSFATSTKDDCWAECFSSIRVIVNGAEETLGDIARREGGDPLGVGISLAVSDPACFCSAEDFRNLFTEITGRR